MSYPILHPAMSVAGIHKLSIELLSLIIYQLPDAFGPQLSLKRASGTCKSFRNLCQELLFRSVTLEILHSETVQKSAQFLLFLRDETDGERIGSYIREITLHVPPSWRGGKPFEHVQNVLQTVITRLPQLRTVRIGGEAAHLTGILQNSHDILPSTIRAIDSASAVDTIFLDCIVPRLHRGPPLSDISKLASLRVWLIKEHDETSMPESGTVVSEQIADLLNRNHRLKHLHVCLPHIQSVDYLEITPLDQYKAAVQIVGDLARLPHLFPSGRRTYIASPRDEIRSAWNILGESHSNLESLVFQGQISVNIGPYDPWAMNFRWEALKLLRVDNLELTEHIVERYQDRLVSLKDLKIAGTYDFFDKDQERLLYKDCPLKNLKITTLEKLNMQLLPLDLLMRYLESKNLRRLKRLRFTSFDSLYCANGGWEEDREDSPVDCTKTELSSSHIDKLRLGCPNLELLSLSFCGPCLLRTWETDSSSDESEYDDPFDLMEAIARLENVQHLRFWCELGPSRWDMGLDEDVVNTFSYIQNRKLGRPLQSFVVTDRLSNDVKRLIVAQERGKASLHYYGRSDDDFTTTRTTSLWDTDTVVLLTHWEDENVTRRSEFEIQGLYDEL